jgi:hypothetical protein
MVSSAYWVSSNRYSVVSTYHYHLSVYYSTVRVVTIPCIPMLHVSGRSHDSTFQGYTHCLINSIPKEACMIGMLIIAAGCVGLLVSTLLSTAQRIRRLS